MMGKHVLYCGKQGNGQAAKAQFLLPSCALVPFAHLFLHIAVDCMHQS